MQEELQQTKDLAKLAIASNEPPFETRRPPPPLPSLSSLLPNYFPTHTTGPITSTPNPPTIDLIVSNAPYAITSYQTPPLPLNHNQVPNTSHSQNFIPTNQIPPPISNNPHVLYSQPVHPTVTFQTPPTYTIPKSYPSLPVEKEWRLREEKYEKEINVMKDAISEAVKTVQSSRKISGLEYEDFCMHPDLEIPEGYKIPKFDTFNELIKMGEAIEDGLKFGKVTSLTALQAANKASPSIATGFARKKKEDVSAVSFSPRPRLQRYFESGSAIGNSNQFSKSNNYPPPPQAPIPIYYAQLNYQPSRPIYQNQPPVSRSELPPRHGHGT
ncbi:hypothetical protein R3W88_027050 [Solanum pinnatisectum]|uniref:Uncharacterized protein n=1 Tax=Solanum pinnatisectum TaxID=50273 RepID=A0AAV9LEX4_9SOLN|nr:hypothetical protein R3W88_027050 [Solanum pinnatisectum]